METTKVLVTGGTGYIGSHMVVELINLGYASSWKWEQQSRGLKTTLKQNNT